MSSIHDLERQAHMMSMFRHRVIGFILGVVTTVVAQTGWALLWE